MRFYTADTHFGDQRCMSSCHRPFTSLEEMRTQMMDRWNTVVTPADTVYHLGDVGTCPNLLLKWILQRLNGYKVLVRGNHDKHLTHDFWKKLGFKESWDNIEMEIGGKKCLLRHEPLEIKKIPAGIHVVVCGHIHNIRPAPPKNLCISVELTNYMPLAEQQLIDLMKVVPKKYTTTSTTKGTEEHGHRTLAC